MREPICSTIIPTYNHGEYIERSVTSALNQTLPNAEVIVVDDGSTDNTSEILTRFKSEILYVRKENGGLGAARNTGIRKSRGKYLQFLDADDLIEKEKLERQSAILNEEAEDVALVYSDCRNTDFEGNLSKNISYQLDEDEDPLPVLLYRVLSSLNACLVRRDSVISIGMFDEDRTSQEDWDFWFRLRLKGFRFKYSPGDFVHYDQQGSEMTNNPELMYRRTQHMLRKHLANPDFVKLSPSIVKDFVAHQNLTLATKAYNNGWWRRARSHFLAALYSNPRLIDVRYWPCIPKTFLHQVTDAFSGSRRTEPENLDR